MTRMILEEEHLGSNRLERENPISLSKTCLLSCEFTSRTSWQVAIPRFAADFVHLFNLFNAKSSMCCTPRDTHELLEIFKVDDDEDDPIEALIMGPAMAFEAQSNGVPLSRATSHAQEIAKNIEGPARRGLQCLNYFFLG